MRPSNLCHDAHRDPRLPTDLARNPVVPHDGLLLIERKGDHVRHGVPVKLSRLLEPSLAYSLAVCVFPLATAVKAHPMANSESDNTSSQGAYRTKPIDVECRIETTGPMMAEDVVETLVSITGRLRLVARCSRCCTVL